VTFNNSRDGIFNNFYLYFVDSNKRNKEISIVNNTFYNMNGSTKYFIQISNFSPGVVTFEDNIVTNCSSSDELFEISGSNNIIIKNNLFKSIVASTNGLILTSSAQVVDVSYLEVTNITHSSLLSASPLIRLGTQEMGKCIFEYSEFYENNIKSNAIAIDYSVGSLTFKHNVFHDEIIAAFTNYVRLENLYELSMENSTFRNMATDNSNDRITLLFNFVAVNLSIDGSFEMNTLTLSNISMSLLSLSSIIGGTSSNKTVIISNVVFTDALFPTRNNFITFGPFITTQNIIIKMKNLEFSNLNFLNTANIIEVSMQAPTPVLIDS
jgi:hypothetical protein